MFAREEGRVPVTYFACTLGEAQQINKHKVHFRSVSHLIEKKADESPNDFAAGFATPRDGAAWTSDVFTYAQLRNGSILGEDEKHALRELAGATSTIALLCPSSIDFLFTWLRLMRAGYSVLLIAPQCHPEAIAHLCKVSDASILLYHDMYADLAISTSRLPHSIMEAVRIPWQDFSCYQEKSIVSDSQPAADNNIAFIFHTSGTSGGLPKAIPQTQHGVVGVLPSLNGKEAASFTTTPLYHGGIADCLRTWSSGAMIWLFPGAEVPITNKNVMKCVEAAKKASETQRVPTIQYFSSVPYILEMLASEKESLEMLRKLEMVGVGGAALSPKVGDKMVNEGINLLSRFGSAECGFLLSSHRDYAHDKEWQYLRPPAFSPQLKFELQPDGSNLSELIILNDWPHMSKRNRDDGSFATSDLFEPHPSIKGAWRYHSRSDSQITLVTGKKFDPAPVEDAIRSTLDSIKDVLVVGNGKPEAAAIIILSETSKNSSELEGQIWSVVKDLNGKGQSHTRIARGMVSIIPAEEKGLEKSSKGTILRRKAEDRFSKVIEKLYGGGEGNNGKQAETEAEIKAALREIVNRVAGDKDIEGDSDFYQFGIDSNQCTKIRNLLQRSIKLEDELPFNVVYDCGNINRLADFLIKKRIGSDQGENEQTQHDLMLGLVSRHSDFSSTSTSAAPRRSGKPLILLTGATGSLGAHILSSLISQARWARIVCLVRATDFVDARYRVQQSLLLRKKPALLDDNQMVLAAPCKLSRADLGLDKKLFNIVKDDCYAIIHAAWPVNFSLSLQSFTPQFATLQNLINLSLASSTKPPLLFCSSTASVLGPSHPCNLPELISHNPSDSDSLGYSRSKWVAESICAKAVKAGCNAKVLRIGQLTGDTNNGIWNMSEAYPMMLSTVKELGCLPRLKEDLTWLPVDVAARAVLDILFHNQGGEVESECPVFHITNNNRSTKWIDFLNWQQKYSSFKIVNLEAWLQKLEKLENHPARNLSWLWKKNIKSGAGEEKEAKSQITFQTTNAERVSVAMRNVGPVDEDLVRKIWMWLEREMAAEEKVRSKL